MRSPYREPEVFAQAGGYPHGVAFRLGGILITYTDGIYSAPHTTVRPALGRAEQRLIAALLSGGGGHSSRTVRVRPDGRVYANLGISGNSSNQFLGEDYPFQDRHERRLGPG